MTQASKIVQANPGFELLEACTNIDTCEILLQRILIIAWRVEQDIVLPETQAHYCRLPGCNGTKHSRIFAIKRVAKFVISDSKHICRKTIGGVA
jgi:hypothetical protein